MECGASFGELLDLVHDVRIVIIVIYNLLCSSKLFLLFTIAKLHFQILALLVNPMDHESHLYYR